MKFYPSLAVAALALSLAAPALAQNDKPVKVAVIAGQDRAARSLRRSR